MTLTLRLIVAGLCAMLLALSGNTFAQTWRKLPGTANDIGVGANGVAWVIGDTAVSGGYSIHRFNGIGWELVPGGAVRIDVDSKGNPWIVNSAGNIYRWTGTGWELKPGKATDIGIGANGAVWIIGHTAEGGGYGIYRWGGTSWVKVTGSAVRIDVDSAGIPWIINSTGAIYRWSGSAFVKMPGAGVDISAGGDDVYLAGLGVLSTAGRAVTGKSSKANWPQSAWMAKAAPGASTRQSKSTPALPRRPPDRLP